MDKQNLTAHLPDFPELYEDEPRSQAARNRFSLLLSAAKGGRVLSESEKEYLLIYARTARHRKTRLEVERLKLFVEEEERDEDNLPILSDPDLSSRAINYMREAEKARFEHSERLIDRVLTSEERVIENLMRELESERENSRKKDQQLFKYHNLQLIESDLIGTIRENLRPSIVRFFSESGEVPRESAPSLADKFFSFLEKIVPKVSKGFGIKLEEDPPAQAAE